MRQVTVNMQKVLKLTIVPALNSMHPKSMKVIDDGTPYWKLENGCLHVRRYSFSSSYSSNGNQLNGWINLGRSGLYDLDSLSQPVPFWSAKLAR